MGAGVSQEQITEHLERQAALVQKLQDIVDKQQKTIDAKDKREEGAAQAEEGGIDYSVDGTGEDPIPPNEDIQDEVEELPQIAYQAERRIVEVPIDDDEKKEGNVEWIEPTEEEEAELKGTKPWLAAMAPPDGFEYGKNDHAPNVSLELDYVFGCRLKGIRNSVLWIDDHTILYFSGAVAVVHDINTNAQKMFRSHQDDITCVAFHKTSGLVATGEQGRFPAVYIWDVNTCEEKTKITGVHRRLITGVGFSKDGSKVVSVGCENIQTVAVNDVTSGDLIASETMDDTASRILDVKFNGTEGYADGNADFVTVGVHHVVFWTIKEGGQLDRVPGQLGNIGTYQPFLTVCFTPTYTVIGTQSGELYFFKELNKLFKIIDAHQHAIFSVQSGGPDTVVSGGKDGYISVWSTKTFRKIRSTNLSSSASSQSAKTGSFKIVRGIDMQEDGDTALVTTATGVVSKVLLSTSKTTPLIKMHFGQSTELWSFGASPTAPLVASSGNDCTVRVWDIEAKKLVAQTVLPFEAQCLAWSPDGEMIALGLHNGTVTILDHKNLELIQAFKRSRKRVECIKFSPDKKLLAVGNAENFVDIFDVENGFSYKGRLTGNQCVVLTLDFSEDSRVLQTASQGYELRYFNLETMSEIEKPRTERNTKWATFSSILGWDVQGIWPRNSDGSEVLSVSRSPCGTMCATGEINGNVKVFRYPCVGSGLDRHGKLTRRPECVIGKGHSENVTKISWSSDGKKLVSTSHLGIFVWNVTPVEAAS